VSARVHARRDPITLVPEDRQGIISRLSDELRKSLTRLFASIRKKAPRVPAELDHQLLARVQDALDQLALEEERVSSSP